MTNREDSASTIVLRAVEVEETLANVLSAAGFSEETARLVAHHLTEAEMMGVHSHGVIRLAKYVGELEKGVIDHKAAPSLKTEHANLICVDGGRGIGIAAMEYALDRLMEMIEHMPLACAGIVNCDHTGRIGAYAERAAEAGCVTIITGGGGREKWPNVAPYGGKQGVMSTNPYALSVPGEPGDPLVCDFATSVWSTGGVVAAQKSGAHLMEGVGLDKDGRPTVSPEAVLDKGCLLPAAGPKGSGLAVVAEALGSAFLGPAHQFNWLMILLRGDAFRPLSSVRQDTAAFMRAVRETPPADGVRHVMTPGERERRGVEKSMRDGMELPVVLWNEVLATGNRLGI